MAKNFTNTFLKVENHLPTTNGENYKDMSSHYNTMFNCNFYRHKFALPMSLLLIKVLACLFLKFLIKENFSIPTCFVP